MSFTYNDEIRFSDSPNLDGFSRLRISQPFNIFSSSNSLTSGRTFYETLTDGSGSTTFNQSKSEIQFNVFGNADSVMLEQHGYNYYQPGKSQLIFITGVFGTLASNTHKKMGYYNDGDGLMFQSSGSTFGITLRTSTSGSAVDTFIPQSDWNLDTLNTGSTLNPSGIHLDVSKTNIYVINFQWLGVGRVNFAVDIDGQIIPVHEILNANSKTEVYMKTPNLPVRYEVISSGGTDSTFKQICASVISEGGQEQFGFPTVVSNALTTRTFSSRRAVLSVRLNTNFEGNTNRIVTIPEAIDLLSTTNTVNAYWELILQRVILGENNLGGSPTWTSLSGTPIQYSIDGTTVSGGIVLDSGFFSTTNQSGIRNVSSILKSKNIMALDYSGTASDWLHFVITPSVSSSWSTSIKMTSKY